MTCPCCKAAIETDGHSRMYDSPKCEYCTARLIKRIGGLPIPKSEASARMRACLTDATEYGHNEAQIRIMVKAGPYLAPVANKKKE